MTNKKRKPSSTPTKMREMTTFAENFKFSLQDPEVRKLLGEALGGMLKELMTENEKLKARVKDLEIRLNDSDQYSRRTSIVISGIPEKPRDSNVREDTDLLVLELAQDMGIKLKAEDIGRSHRLTSYKKKTPRDIVCRFLSYNKRADFFHAKKNLRKLPHRKNTFISEHLTKQRAEVFFEARLLRKRGHIDGTWTYDGRICVKMSDKISQVITIEALNETVFGRKKAKTHKKNPVRHMLDAAASKVAGVTSTNDVQVSDTEALSSSSEDEEGDSTLNNSRMDAT